MNEDMIDHIKIVFKVMAMGLVVFGFAVFIIFAIVMFGEAVFGPSAEHRAKAKIPQLISETDGCRVYRFVDSGTHYFTRCGAQVETTRHYTENCGKACTRNRTETLTTEGNK